MTPTEMHIDALMDKDSYKKGFQDGHKCCAYEKEKLLAENTRYREALKLIAEGRISAVSIKHDYIDQAYQEIAREALKGE